MTYKTIYERTIKPNFDKIRDARMKGATVQDIADFLGCSVNTLYNELKKNTEFREMMDEATEQMNVTIEGVARQSLLNKITDRFELVEEIKEDGVVTKQKFRHLPADTTAIIFALKARNPEIWDPLGVARLDNTEETENLNKQILKTLEKYKPKE